jgi:hypothetical protein
VVICEPTEGYAGTSPSGGARSRAGLRPRDDCHGGEQDLNRSCFTSPVVNGCHCACAGRCRCCPLNGEVERTGRVCSRRRAKTGLTANELIDLSMT